MTLGTSSASRGHQSSKPSILELKTPRYRYDKINDTSQACLLTIEQWFDLKSYNSTPTVSETHPFLRQDKFFDSPGPGGIRTPRREASSSRLKEQRLDRSLEVPRNNIQTFAHNGYVYCMLLAPGSVAASPYSEILITGGGDGFIRLWWLKSEDAGHIHEFGRLGNEDNEGDSVLCIILDGTFLYSGRVDGIIDIWDLETRQLLRRLKTNEADVSALSMGRGMLFASFADGIVMVGDLRVEKLVLN